MPEYRRPFAPGATIFFTVVTDGRRPILTAPPALDGLRRAFRAEMTHHPYAIEAIAILPDHLHTIWTLPPGDSRFSMQWSRIKGDFTRAHLAAGGAEGVRSASRYGRGERGIWQRRFWDRVVRDEDEYGALMDYIHWNPVKTRTRALPSRVAALELSQVRQGRPVRERLDVPMHAAGGGSAELRQAQSGAGAE